MSENHSKQKTVVYGDLVEEQETEVKKVEDKKKPQFSVKPFAQLGDLFKTQDNTVKPSAKQDTK